MSVVQLETFRSPAHPDCLINHSRVWSLNNKAHFGEIGIKYVMHGEENYTDGFRRFKVKTGELLLGNSTFQGEVSIQSNEAVKGICIYISQHVLIEVAAFFQLEDDLQTILSKEDFLWHIHSLQRGSELSFALHNVQLLLEKEGQIAAPRFNHFFYHLSEAILADHLWLKGMEIKIPSKKASTSAYLLNRIMQARSIIETSFGVNVNIEELAAITGISTYHFIRLFTATTGISPYAYANQIRMQHASYMLRQGMPVMEVAAQTGYADIHAFSKAFKRLIGHAPSLVN